MLKTQRLTLRKPCIDDLDDLHLVFSAARAMRFWSRPEHTDITETRAFLDDMIDAPADISDEFVIEHQGQVIGKAGAWRIPEIGFILHPDHWRKGLMTEVMLALIPYLFERHDLSQLTAETDPRNHASRGLLAQLGFVETHRAERTMQWRDEWCDSVYLALDRKNWKLWQAPAATNRT